MQVEPITAGWKGLEIALNKIIAAVNFNDPIEGNGIRIYDSGHGKVIETAPVSATPGASPAATGGTTSLSGQVYQVQITLQGVNWQDVQVVDPATCNTSTITVLVQDSSNNLTLNAMIAFA